MLRPLLFLRHAALGVMLVHASFCRAQFNIDSVVRVLNVTSDPIEHLKLLRQLSKADDPAVGGRYAMATIRYADSLLAGGRAGDFTVLTQKGGGLWNFGRHYDRLGLKDSAVIWYERAAAHWHGIGDQERAAFADQNLAQELIDRGSAREALRLLDGVLAFREANTDSAGLVAAHSAMGLACYALGDPVQALVHDNIALDLASRAGLDRFVAQNLLNIGLIYQDQHEPDTALACYRRSVTAFKQAGDPAGCITPLNNAALIHADLGQLPEALALCREGLSIADPAMYPVQTCLLTSTLGVVHRLMGDLDLAVRYGEKAVADAAAGPVAEHKATVLINLGRSLLANDDAPGALARASEAQALFDVLDLSLHRRMYLSLLFADIHARTGPPEKALQHYRDYMTLKDSVANEAIRDQLQRVDLAKQAVRDSLVHAVDVERLENARTVERLRADRNRDRMIQLALVALVLVGGGAAFFIQDRTRRRARFEQQAAQLETQALRSQMNPHFIFNALNSIGSFVQRNEPEQAVGYLTRFARLMRLVLENSRQAEVPLKDDLEALDAYLHLERLRGGEKFDYSIVVDPSIDQEEVHVPPLVIQPFVENAIWHGMAGKEGKGRIRLSVSMNGADLMMAIEDDGVGRHAPKRTEETMAPKKTSLATTITRARLDLVEKQKGRPAGFRYIDLAQGTRVELTLPV